MPIKIKKSWRNKKMKRNAFKLSTLGRAGWAANLGLAATLTLGAGDPGRGYSGRRTDGTGGDGGVIHDHGR
jgi:hypothetical protein